MLILIIKPFQGLRECGQSPQALICVPNLFSVFLFHLSLLSVFSVGSAVNEHKNANFTQTLVLAQVVID